MITRRTFVLRAGGLLAAGNLGRTLLAQVAGPVSPTPITIYKSSTCGCCTKWVDHVREAGFAPTTFDEADMDRIKDQLGVPRPLRSCHTAVVDKYLIEGHVPAGDIRKLLRERPKLVGLAVPEMPSGTPGMAPPGASIAGFTVLGFTADGSTQTFARY
jgi:hypothetical protein